MCTVRLRNILASVQKGAKTFPATKSRQPKKIATPLTYNAIADYIKNSNTTLISLMVSVDVKHHVYVYQKDVINKTEAEENYRTYVR